MTDGPQAVTAAIRWDERPPELGDQGTRRYRSLANTVTSVQVAASITNYASDYQDVDGIIVPAKRRIYAYEGDYQLVKEPLLVAIDFTDIKLA